ncbi:uncharacterized protein LOC110266624 [Arachis ipaensis]|uniref:uncharacterized protein LOC110266624 n=1 Tax=Arachis ipaensis TaxID=130454 RepID=UPI000A2AF14D|nr:uncharacterized protein LOC110266624 [Arachis ipaensis]
MVLLLIHQVWLAKYSPRLLHWVVTQNCLPSNSVIEKNPAFFNTRDIDILKIILGFPIKEKLREQVIFDTLLGDWIVAFGNWEFDPLKLNNPFGHNISKVHIWQGYEDKVVSSQIQRFVSRNMPWINYGEVSDGTHLIIHYSGLCEAVLRVVHEIFRLRFFVAVPSAFLCSSFHLRFLQTIGSSPPTGSSFKMSSTVAGQEAAVRHRRHLAQNEDIVMSLLHVALLPLHTPHCCIFISLEAREVPSLSLPLLPTAAPYFCSEQSRVLDE